MAAPVGWVGSGSRRVNLPSVTVATVPQRAMHRLQYPSTWRTSGISADIRKLPRGNASCMWPHMGVAVMAPYASSRRHQDHLQLFFVTADLYYQATSVASSARKDKIEQTRTGTGNDRL